MVEEVNEEKRVSEQKKQQEDDKQKVVQDRVEFYQDLATNDDVGEIFQRVVEFGRQLTHSSSCSLARKMDGGEETPSSISFLVSTQPFMNGKSLTTSLNEEEEPSPISFDLWKPSIPGPVNEEDPEAEVAMVCPSHLHVPNAMRNDRTSFFKIPKLGGLLVVPVTYGSILHPEGVKENDPPPEAEEGEGEEDGEKEEEEAPKEPEGEWEKYVKNPIDVSFAIYFDTLGLGREFTGEEIENALGLARAVEEALLAYEDRLFKQEVDRLKTLNPEEWEEAVGALKEKLGSAREEGENAGNEAVEALGEEAEEMEKEIAQLTAILSVSSTLLSDNGNIALQFGEHRLPPTSSVLSALAISCLAGGVPSSEIRDAGGVVDWAKLRTKLGDVASSAKEMDPAEPAVVSKEESVGSLLQELSEVDGEAMGEENPVGALFLRWTQAYLGLRKLFITKNAGEEGSEPIEEICEE